MLNELSRLLLTIEMVAGFVLDLCETRSVGVGNELIMESPFAI